MRLAVNKRHLTPQTPGGCYLPVVINGNMVLALYDPGSNATIISDKLARELGEAPLPYNNTFRQAAGAKGRFSGKLGQTKLQLHEKLTLDVVDIRVMATEDSQLQFILGTDLFNPGGQLFRELSTSNTPLGIKEILVEADEEGSGEIFRLKTKEASRFRP